MKQYLDSEQTERLLELGFPGPTSVSYLDENIVLDGETPFAEYNYSIGELLSFFPSVISNKDGRFMLDIFPAISRWFIVYFDRSKENELFRWGGREKELIDVMFRALVQMKTEKVLNI